MRQSAVVDASVLVSGFLFPGSVPGRVIRLAERGIYTLHFSPILIEEVTRSLKNPRLKGPYGHRDDDIQAWWEEVKTFGKLYTRKMPDIGSVCRDPNDDHVIACAIAVKAQWIVKGDHDLLELKAHVGVRIVAASTFLDEMGKD